MWLLEWNIMLIQLIKAIIMKHHRKNSNLEFHSPVRNFNFLDIVLKRDYGYKMDEFCYLSFHLN